MKANIGKKGPMASSSTHRAPPSPMVLLLGGAKGDTRRYRLFHAWEQLQLAGIPAHLADITEAHLPRLIPEGGLLILHRVIFDSWVEKLLAQAAAQDCLAVVDIDDLLFDPSAFRWIDSPDFQVSARARLYQEDMRRHRLTLEACQAVIASTEYLADCVRPMKRAVWVLRNAFSMEMLTLSASAADKKSKTPGRVVIGYASGTPTHDRDFALLQPILCEILAKYLQVELWLLGPVHPGTGWGRSSSRVRQFKRVDWRELPGWLARFDVNLAPLQADNPFAQSKSEIKYVEAGLVRTPTIASVTSAFEFAIHPGENGYLARDGRDWLAFLCALIENPDLRVAVGERAYQDVLVRYHPATRAIERATALNEIAQSVSGRAYWEGHQKRLVFDETLIFTTSVAMERRPTYLERGLYTLRHRGPFTLMVQIWILIRRLLAIFLPFKAAH
ncbi:MAG: glycosyltransferase [Anaerolineales bacterium]|nr:glycosyltransferase [Anaerolineales bacterium]